MKKETAQSYIVTWKPAYASRRKYARRTKGSKCGKKIEFPTRQKAAQWVRNHRYMVAPGSSVIVHPDGTKEPYYPNRQ